MSTKIYWFSGTGNSLAVAKQLAEGLSDAELISIAQAVSNPPEASARIGIVCPVYAFGPPAIVERLIEKLHVVSGAYIFAVFTCAASSGGAARIVRRRLRRSGLDLDASWTVKMPENYPPLGGTPGPQYQNKKNAVAKTKTQRILDELKNSPRGKLQRSSIFWRAISYVAHPAFRWFMRHGADRPFQVDRNCNGCGLCARVCPVGNIVMKGGHPVWLGHCEQCFACFHWCPQKSVQYGFSSGLRRYHHPEVTVSDVERE